MVYLPISGEAGAGKQDDWFWEVPDSLIVNGDLTGYFHPGEKSEFDGFMSDVSVLFIASH